MLLRDVSLHIISDGKRASYENVLKCIYPKEPSCHPYTLYYGNKAPYGVNLPYVKGQPFLSQKCMYRSQKWVCSAVLSVL